MASISMQRQRPHQYQGSVLLEGLVAIFIFSIGLLSILMLLSAALIEVGNARYRSEASLLAADLLSEMWTGDRALTALQTRFGSSGATDFQAWQSKVSASLPGITASANQPVVSIDNQRRVTITLFWQSPGEAIAHTYLTTAVITD